MSVKRRLGRNMVWNTAGLTVEIAAAFLVTPFLIIRLGEATYGIWIVLGALTGYFGLLDLGIRGSIGRHVALHHANGDQRRVNETVTGGLTIFLLVGLVVIGGVFACVPLFYQVYDVPPEQHAATSLALCLIAVQFAVFLLSTGFDATLWGLERFDSLNAVDIPVAVVRMVLTFALVRSAGDLVVLAYITLGCAAATAAAKAALAFRAMPRLRVGWGYLSGSSIRELLGVGGWYSLWLLGRVTRRQLSPLLIGSLLALALVAPFSIVERMLAMTAALLTAVTGVLTPFATALHATDQTDRQRRLFLAGGRHTAAFATFVIVGLLVLGDPFIDLWIGPKFADATVLLLILAAGELLPSTQYVTNGILVGSARHRAIAAFSVLETVTVCVLAFTLIPALGLVGAGLAIAVPAFFTRGVAPLVLGCRLVQVSVSHYLVRIVGPSLLCGIPPAAVIGPIVIVYPPVSWVLFGAYSLAYALLVAVCYGCLMGKTRLVAIYTDVTSMLRRRVESPVGSA